MVTEENDNETDGWLPKTSLSSIIALRGLGFTAFDLFLHYKSQRVGGEKTEPEIGLTETFVPPAVKSDLIQRYGME